MSPDFKSGLAFGTIMVLIGLAAIWIVRWQTYFTIRHQARQDHNMNLHTPSDPRHEEAASSDGPAVVLDTTANLFPVPETLSEVSIATLAVISRDTATDE